MDRTSSHGIARMAKPLTESIPLGALPIPRTIDIGIHLPRLDAAHKKG